MYTLVTNEDEKSRITEVLKGRSAEAMQNALNGLIDNPHKRAKKMVKPDIGECYVNCGRYCLTLEIDEKNKSVKIIKCLSSNHLDKILRWN